MTIQEIDQRLEALRQEYVICPLSMKEIIKRQARALKIAREKIEKKVR